MQPVIETSAQTWWHLTTDLLAEGIHFDLKSVTPESVGYRAAMANLSDIAAMGAVPRYLLISLAIPRTVKRSHIDELYAGLMKACRFYDVALIGGDTSASKTGLFLSITLVGTTSGRSGAFSARCQSGRSHLCLGYSRRLPGRPQTLDDRHDLATLGKEED